MIRVVHTKEPHLSVLIKPSYDTDGCVIAGIRVDVFYPEQCMRPVEELSEIVSAAECFFQNVHKADCFAFSRWKTYPYPTQEIHLPGR